MLYAAVYFKVAQSKRISIFILESNALFTFPNISTSFWCAEKPKPVTLKYLLSSAAGICSALLS
jgi:hypothetical protein